MPPSWRQVRAQFDLDPSLLHLGASQYVSSHPRPVRDAIERYRRELDQDPVGTLERHNEERMDAAGMAIARALGGRGTDVALTESTTQGLGLAHAGLPLRRGDEVLSTAHEHYAQWEAIRQACRLRGARPRHVALHDGDASDARAEDLVQAIAGAVTRRTRVVAVTWVMSDTGLKLPVRELARRLREAPRPPLLVVDATHGFGVEAERAARLGADVVVGDCHKWVYGPRGTGFVWARAATWGRMQPLHASFTDRMDAYAHARPLPRPMTGIRFTPGGFHAFEHRWAVPAAFAFRRWVGGDRRIQARVHALAAHAKRVLAEVPGVHVVTPPSARLSAGIVAVRLAGLPAKDAAERLRDRGVVATVAPYPTAFLRFTPGLYNDEAQVEAGAAALADVLRLGGARRRRRRPAPGKPRRRRDGTRRLALPA